LNRSQQQQHHHPRITHFFTLHVKHIQTLSYLRHIPQPGCRHQSSSSLPVTTASPLRLRSCNHGTVLSFPRTLPTPASLSFQLPVPIASSKPTLSSYLRTPSSTNQQGPLISRSHHRRSLFPRPPIGTVAAIVITVTNNNHTLTTAAMSSEQSSSTSDLRSASQDSKRDATRKHKWGMGALETRGRGLGNPRPLRPSDT
jgi:hypothetical protein